MRRSWLTLASRSRMVRCERATSRAMVVNAFDRRPTSSLVSGRVRCGSRLPRAISSEARVIWTIGRVMRRGQPPGDARSRPAARSARPSTGAAGCRARRWSSDCSGATTATRMPPSCKRGSPKRGATVKTSSPTAWRRRPARRSAAARDRRDRERPAGELVVVGVVQDRAAIVEQQDAHARVAGALVELRRDRLQRVALRAPSARPGPA